VNNQELAATGLNPPLKRVERPYSQCPHCGEYNYKKTQVSEDGEKWHTVRKQCGNCKYIGEEYVE